MKALGFFIVSAIGFLEEVRRVEAHLNKSRVEQSHFEVLCKQK